MTSTEAQLLEVHKSAVLRLDDVAKQYFNLSAAEARRRAGLNLLSVPTFRLVDSQKAPLLVRVSDLAAAIDKRAEEAAAAYAHSQI